MGFGIITYVNIIYVIASLTLIPIILVIIEDIILVIKTCICWKKMKPGSKYTVYHFYYNGCSEVYLFDEYIEYQIKVNKIDWNKVYYTVTKIEYYKDKKPNIKTYDEVDHWAKFIIKYSVYKEYSIN